MKLYSVRSIRRLALLAGLMGGFAACSGQNTDLTGPSASLSSTSSTGSGSTTVGTLATPVRTFAAGITPSPVNALSTTQYTVTINNNGSGSGNGAAILGVNIAVPPAFSTPAGLSAVENGSVNWNVSFSPSGFAGLIHVTAPPSGELNPGETLVVTFTLVAPNQACGTSHAYEFTTTANKEREFTGEASTITSSQPSVTVNGPECTGACSGQLSQGAWKNASTWPVASLMLGSRSYTRAEALSILNQPAQGNGLIILSYQLIAAKLNIANGSNPAGIASTIVAADALIGANVVPPVGSDFVSPATIQAVKDALEAYNKACEQP